MKIQTLARFVDQPIFINKIQKQIPALLIGAGGVYGVLDTYKNSKGKQPEEKKKLVLKNAIILTSAAGASLAAANGLRLFGKQIIPRLIERVSLTEQLKKHQESINKYLQSVSIGNDTVTTLLNGASKRHFSLKEVDFLLNKLPESEAKKTLFDVILPKPGNLSSKEIFSEIGRLSLLGAIPVVGGVAGGLVADKVTNSSTPRSTANKIKEGFYQYFANIFLCNVGACAALFAAEGLQKMGVLKPLSPVQKMAVIMSGIVATGIVGGSWIANKMSQKIIDPVFNKGNKVSYKGVYSERKPELVDVALHVDDIATAGVLSGFKWIEPALPLMYFVSGYRAGIGYRNNNMTK